MLIMMSLMMSIFFIMMNHPLSMGLILLIQTIIISMITSTLSLNYWFSYILFLIMIGGMLVLFIYMTSVASNELFKFSYNLMNISIMIMILMFILYFNYNYMYMNFEFNINNNFNNNFMFNKFINFPSNLIMFMMIIYLFITLIAVVKITNMNYGPLRQKF
uniref:NADH-ubiquinone oxidoreductase chain 6 n=1 Tax=Astenus lyonessius TaxID=347273 RepID=A0A0S2M6J1_9COLE|nr:NADH deshydrogenase subunit 6 [Astenus lyonessius]